MAEKVFHPDRVIYIDNVPHPIEGSVRPTRMGFECPLLPGDNPQEFFDWAENEVKQWADARVKRVMANDGAAGAGGRELPTNITLIIEGEKRLFTTRGDDRCTADRLRQEKLPDPGVHAYRVVGRGFCTLPAMTLDRAERIVITRFDFAGRVSLRIPHWFRRRRRRDEVSCHAAGSFCPRARPARVGAAATRSRPCDLRAKLGRHRRRHASPAFRRVDCGKSRSAGAGADVRA